MNERNSGIETMKYRGRKGRKGSMYFTHFCLSFYLSFCCLTLYLSLSFWSNLSQVTRFFIPWKALIVNSTKGLTDRHDRLSSCPGELKTDSAPYLLDFFAGLHPVFVSAVFYVQFEWYGWNMKSYLWSEKRSVWMEGAEKEQDLTATLNLGSDLGS